MIFVFIRIKSHPAMKTRIIACLMLCAILPGFSLNSKAQKPYRKINNQAFTTGERLEYRIHYGIINAAGYLCKLLIIPRW